MIFPLELAAHYLRCLELCKRLKPKFDIKIAYSAKYAKFIEEVGLETFRVENFDPEEIKSAAARFDFSWLNLTSIGQILESQITVVKEYEPDIVLGDASFPLKMAAEKTRTRFVSMLNGYMTKHYQFTRKVSRAHPGYEYSKKMPATLFDYLTRLIEYVSFRKIHEPFRQLRKELELSPQNSFLDELEGEKNLICDLPELFPQKSPPPNYCFIGPMFYRGSDPEQEILDFMADNRSNILVSMGSSGSMRQVAFLNNPIFKKCNIVVSGDPNMTLKGPNIINKLFINHMAIMPKIDIMICHGGNGTIYQGLSRGVPILSIPNNFEQEWNAQRIEELGLGCTIENSATAEEVHELVNFWIEKRRDAAFTSFKQKIHEFSQKSIQL